MPPMENGLGPGATLFCPADVALSIMRERGEVKPDVAEYLEALGTHLVRIQGKEVVAITFDDGDLETP